MSGDGENGQTLRERLLGLVPQPPVAHDRPGAVRRRAAQLRRRRTVGTVVVATAAVGLVAAVAGLGPLHDDDIAPVAPTPFTAAACPAAPVEPDLGSELPGDVVAVRACGVLGPSVPVPDDALVTDVDAFMAELADQPGLGPGAACTRELGAGYTLQLQLSDGTLRHLRGELYGCNQLVLGSGEDRSGAEVVYGAFTRLLRRQRADLEPPGVFRQPQCADAAPAGGLPTVADLGQAGRALLCPRGNAAAVAVPVRDLEILVTAWRRAKGRIGKHAGCGGKVDRLVVVTTWNDVLAVDLPCGLWFGHGLRIGRSGPAAQAIIDRLLGAEEGTNTPDDGATTSDPGYGGGPVEPRPTRRPTRPTDATTGPTENPSGTPTDGGTATPGPTDPTTDPEPTDASGAAGRVVVRRDQ